MLRFLFGDDIFISYSRRDAIRYAEGLAAELADRGFSCRLDQWGSEPGKEMPESLIRGLRRAAMLVVVGTPGSAQSPHVEQEIDEFVRTRRPIIPIEIHGCVESARWFSKVQGLVLEVETAPDALDRGQPSTTVLGRIENSYTYTRRNARIQRTFWGTLVAVALMLAAGGTILWMLRGQVTAAETERDELGSKVETANAELDDVQENLQQRVAEVTAAQASLATAESDLTEAQSGLEAATADLGAARELERQARTAADLQERVAESRRLASLGESLFEREGPRVTALLAVEALARSPTPEAYRVLARALLLLPLPERRLELPAGAPERPIMGLTFSPDGARCAAVVRASDGGVVLWDIATGEAAWRPIEWLDSIVFSSSGRYLLALGTDIHLLDGSTAALIGFRIDTPVETDAPRFAFAPDERRVALSVRPGEIEIRSLPDAVLEATLTIRSAPTSDPVRGLAFTPGGRFLAAGWRDRLLLWAGPEWDSRREWEIGSGYREMAVDPRGESIAVAGGGSVELIRLDAADETKKPVRSVADGGHLSVHFSDNAERFAAREERAAAARVWNRDGSPVLASLPRGGVTDARLSPDGRRLALARAAQSYLWNLDQDEILYRFPYGQHVRFAPNGERIASTGPEAKVDLWRPEGAWPLAAVALPAGTPQEAVQIRISPTGEHVAAARGATARVWSRTTGVVSALDIAAANAVTLSQDGHWIAVDVGEATLVHDVTDLSRAVRLEVPEPLDWQAIRERDLLKGSRRPVLTVLMPAEESGSTRTLAIGPRSSLVATLRADDFVRLWELPSGREIRRWPFPWLPESLVGDPPQAAFSEDEQILAVMKGSSIAIWDTLTGTAHPRIDFEGRAERIELSYDGSHLALSTFRTVSIYDTTTGRLERELSKRETPETLIFAPDRTVALSNRTAVRADWQSDPLAAARASFRPQARTLVRISRDGPELVDLRDPKSIRLFPNEATVTGVAVSQQGDFFAAASVLDVRIYDARSGEELARIPDAGRDPVFGPTGELLALRTADRVVVYRWQREALIEEACRRVVTDLTCEEWERYVGSRDCRAVCH